MTEPMDSTKDSSQEYSKEEKIEEEEDQEEPLTPVLEAHEFITKRKWSRVRSDSKSKKAVKTSKHPSESVKEKEYKGEKPKSLEPVSADTNETDDISVEQTEKK